MKINDPADNCACLQINHRSLNVNILNKPLQGIKILRSVELHASGSLLRNSRLSHTAWLQQERVNYSTLCFPFVFDVRSFYDFWGFTVMHKQNDISRENSNTKYFWVITKPVLPTCRQFLTVCLFVWLYQRGLMSHMRVALLCKFF